MSGGGIFSVSSPGLRELSGWDKTMAVVVIRSASRIRDKGGHIYRRVAGVGDECRVR